MEAWQSSLRNAGLVSVKISRLSQLFGIKRRTRAQAERASAWLRGLDPPIYLDGFGPDFSRTGQATLSSTPIERAGAIFTDAAGKRGSEQELKDVHGESMLEQPPLSLEILFPRRNSRDPKKRVEYSPTGTRDSIDYLCRDRDGRLVVVELKVDHGERRGVEQLLRYVYQVAEDPKLKGEGVPRGILITAQADHATKDALAILDPFELIEWYVYGIDASGTKVKVKRVKNVLRRGDPRDWGEVCPTCKRARMDNS